MRQTTKIMIMMLAVSIIGIGMPTTLSVGTGQHQFRQIDPTNPNEFCEKCHGLGDSIQAELKGSGMGIYNNNNQIHFSLTCVECHRVSQGYGTSIPGEKSEHAARIPLCVECHVRGQMAGFLGNVTSELESNTESHKTFNEDDNIACIGCHTEVDISGSVTYSYSEGMIRMGLKIGD